MPSVPPAWEMGKWMRARGTPPPPPRAARRRAAAAPREAGGGSFSSQIHLPVTITFFPAGRYLRARSGCGSAIVEGPCVHGMSKMASDRKFGIKAQVGSGASRMPGGASKLAPCPPPELLAFSWRLLDFNRFCLQPPWIGCSSRRSPVQQQRLSWLSPALPHPQHPPSERPHVRAAGRLLASGAVEVGALPHGGGAGWGGRSCRPLAASHRNRLCAALRPPAPLPGWPQAGGEPPGGARDPGRCCA